MTARDGRPDTGLLATVGLAAAAVFCCAGPVLFGAGAVSVIGGALRNPWLLFLGGALVVVAVGWSLRRRQRDRVCCSEAGCARAPAGETGDRSRNALDDRSGAGER